MTAGAARSCRGAQTDAEHVEPARLVAQFAGLGQADLWPLAAVTFEHPQELKPAEGCTF